VAKVVLATAGSDGDVHPFIAIGLSLKARGIDTVIATRAGFRGKIEREGLGFHELRPDLADLEAAGLAPEAVARGVTDPVTGLRFLLKRLILPFARASFDDLLAACDGADLMVAHRLVLTAPLVAEYRDLPWMSAVLQPLGFFSAYDPPVTGWAPALDAIRPLLGPAVYRPLLRYMAEKSAPWFEPLRALRSELGLPPDPRSPLLEGPYGSRGTLGLYSKLFGEIQPDHPPGTRIVGFAAYDSQDGGSATLPPELAAFLDAGEPPVVFTLGASAAMNPGDFYQVSAQAAQRAGVRAVLVMGPVGQAARPETLCENIIACAYVPYSALFPRALIIAHPGGIGAGAQALMAGRPQLVTPFMADQPDNAAHLTRLGVARTLSPKRFTAASASRAIEALASRLAYADAARRAAVVMATENGAETAADVIARAITG